MIRVQLRPEPDAFDQTVRQPGLSAIAELVGEEPLPDQQPLNPQQVFHDRASIPGRRFPNYWKHARCDLLRAYDRTCAFSGLRVKGSSTWPSNQHLSPDERHLTIDHMVPKSKEWRLVYEWNNLRLACRILNERKGAEEVLDPTRIDANGDAWFHMEIVEFRLFPNPELDPDLKKRIEITINRLRLNNPAWRGTRRVHFEQFEKHRRISDVQRACPYVAREIRRMGQDSITSIEV